MLTVEAKGSIPAEVVVAIMKRRLLLWALRRSGVVGCWSIRFPAVGSDVVVEVTFCAVLAVLLVVASAPPVSFVDSLPAAPRDSGLSFCGCGVIADLRREWVS
jgi:hypothetical protein